MGRPLVAAGLLLIAVAWLTGVRSSGRTRDPVVMPKSVQPGAERAHVDDIQRAGEAPPVNPANLLRNSSLEHCTVRDLPDWWRPGEAWSDFRAHNIGVEYELQERIVRFHSRAILLRNTRNGNRSALDYPYMQVPDKSRPCCFSVYLRASRPGFKARIGIYGGFDRSAVIENATIDGNSVLKQVEVGTEWRRYSLTSPRFRPDSTVRNRVAVIAESVGELYIDGLQLESGSEPTPYGPRADDAPVPTGPSAPDVVARRTLKPVTLDGVLDERAWTAAPPADGFVRLADAGKPDALTRARVLFDEQALCVGFVCEESLQPKVAYGSVLDSDHVEVIVSAHASGGSYLRYAADTSGRVRASLERGSARETGASAAAYVGASQWTAELRIPFSELGLPRSAPEALRINFVRFRAASGEWSAYSYPGSTVHAPAALAGLVGLDPRTLEEHGAGALDVRIVAGRSGTRVEGVLESRSARRKPELSVRVDGFPASAHVSWDGDRCSFTAPVDGEANTSRTVEVVQADSRTGAPVATRYARGVRVLPKCEVFFERNYYTTEPTAKLIVAAHDETLGELSAQPDDGSGSAVPLNVADGVGTLEVPLSGRPYGTMWFRVLSRGQEVGRAKLVIRPPKRNEVKIDYRRRCLVVEDKPFIVMSPGWLVRDNLPAIAPDAFNTVMLKRWHPPTGAIYSLGQVTEEGLGALRDFMDAAWARRLRVIFHLPMKLNDNSCNNDELAITKLVAEFSDHPALLAWHTVDEPGPRTTPEDLLRVANLVRGLDPYHPVWINEATFWNDATEYCRSAQPACDVFSVDHYPVPDQGVLTIASWTERLNEITRWRKPVWMWLQAFGAIEWWSREPTPAEERTMTYLALVHGSRGILYFVYRPRSRVLWDECQRLGREVLGQVAPILADAVSTTPVFPDDPAIAAARFTTGEGSRYVLAVNTGPLPTMLRVGRAVSGLDGPLALEPVVIPEGNEPHLSGTDVALPAAGACLVRVRALGEREPGPADNAAMP